MWLRKNKLRKLGCGKPFLKPWETGSASGQHCLFCPGVLEGKEPNSKPKIRHLAITLSMVIRSSWISISRFRSRISLEDIHSGSGVYISKCQINLFQEWNTEDLGQLAIEISFVRTLCRYLHWKHWFFSSHETQTEDAGGNFNFFGLYLSLLKQLFPVCSGKKTVDQILQTSQCIPADRWIELQGQMVQIV